MGFDWLRAEMQRATGRRYRIDIETLDVESFRELQRVLRDYNAERRVAVQRAGLCPWRAL